MLKNYLKLSCTLGLMSVVPLCFGQNNRYVDEVQNALAREDTASTFTSVLSAAKALEQISQTYPDRWEVLYWTAHVYSQASLFTGTRDERYKAYLDTAQVYYDSAWAVKAKKTKEEEAEFYVLQANIYGLRTGYHSARQQWAESGTYEVLDEEYMLRAALTNPNNPRLHMRRGINLMRIEATREQGRAVLQEAILVYEQHPPRSSISPSWGRNWIDYWLARYSSNTIQN